MTRARDLADYIATGVSDTELDILDGLNTTTEELNLIDGSSAGTIVNSKAVIYGSSGEVFGTSNHLSKTATSGDAIGWNFAVSNPSGSVNDLRLSRRFNDTAGTVILDVTNYGHVIPATNNQQELGESGKAWKKIYAIDVDIDGTLETDALSINGTAVTSTAAEINLIDGDTARGTTAVADGDGFLTNDGGTMRMTKVDTLATYMQNKIIGGTSIVTTGALDSGSITSGFGTINTGASAITTTGAITGGSFVIGSADINENDLESIDGITAGTIAASKAAVVDANKDVTGFRNVTLTGELDAGSLDISGDADIDGTLETDALSINGTAVTSTAAELNILDGVTSTAAELNILDGVTSTAAELNILDGVTSTAAELNALDGITAVVGELNALDIGSTAVGTAVASKAVILDSNKDYTGVRNFTLSGELDAGSLDISGNADIDGTLETDNLTVGGAQGSDGQVLTSTGSGVGWEDAGGGAWAYIAGVEIANHSNGSNIYNTMTIAGSDKINHTYDRYFFCGVLATIATNAYGYMAFTNDSGTVDTGDYYRWNRMYNDNQSGGGPSGYDGGTNNWWNNTSGYWNILRHTYLPQASATHFRGWIEFADVNGGTINRNGSSERRWGNHVKMESENYDHLYKTGFDWYGNDTDFGGLQIGTFASDANQGLLVGSHWKLYGLVNS